MKLFVFCTFAVMKALRKLTYPFGLIYGVITAIRNKLFDIGALKSTSFDVPVIVVGNLSVGGTGKTPQVEYLIRLLQDEYRVAVLSRGYKRKTQGFVFADVNSSTSSIGDEPYQYYSKFPKITVVVDANRVNGINQLKKLPHPPEVIILDDAYQHRKVKGKFSIVLTPYHDLYVDDLMLPAGNLREFKSGVSRANVVVVTKCPETVTEEEQQQIASKLALSKEQDLFFSTIAYADVVKNKETQITITDLVAYEVVLVTGIANPKPMLAYLTSKDISFTHLEFPDHYDFKPKDLKGIQDSFNNLGSKQKIILTTEKDFMRLQNDIEAYYLEIKTKLISNVSLFDEKIKACIKL